MKVLVAGGAGFIGSTFVRTLLEADPQTSVTVLDKLTYAGRRENLEGADDARLNFVEGVGAVGEDGTEIGAELRK